MNDIKVMYMEEYERIASEIEEQGLILTDEEINKLADEAVINRRAALIDSAKDRAKYGY